MIVYILFTVMFGTQTPVSVHNSESECEFAITAQKQLGIMDTSNMSCIKFTQSD